MSPLHIDIDGVVRSKSEKLYRKIPGFVLKWLKKTVHQDEMNETLARIGDRKGADFTDAVLEELGISYTVHGLEKLDGDRNYIFASNHPLGGLDGMIAISVLGRKFPKLKVVVNDLLLNITPISHMFVPVNKHGKMDREYAEKLNATYSSDCQIYNFPAGLCSRLIQGKIQDPEWKATFVNQAKRYGRDIVPVFFSGRNSMFFYRLSRIRKRLGIRFNIEMLYLPDEMFRQKGAHFDIYIGDPISCSRLSEGTAKEWTEKIRQTSYNLKDDYNATDNSTCGQKSDHRGTDIR